MKKTAILLIDCPDQKGIVAGVADFLYRHHANILHADQHQDAERDLFLMRVEWDLEDRANSCVCHRRKEFELIATSFSGHNSSVYSSGRK
ncbi:MAG: ACT domain-containing protein, partial [Gemmataceae bacterium]